MSREYRQIACRAGSVKGFDNGNRPTDYPFPCNCVPVDHILSIPGLSDDDRIAILGGTAAKLLANRIALLRSSTTAKTIALTEGRELDGWTLREIGRERLRFESGGTTYDMKFPLAQKPAR